MHESVIKEPYLWTRILNDLNIRSEDFEDTKAAIRFRKLKNDRQHYGQKKKRRTKGQTAIYKTLHRKQ